MQTEDVAESCFILPVLPHKIGNVRDFWDDAAEKFSNETDGHLKLFGVEGMLVFLQAIPEKGDYMVMYMKSRDALDKTFHGLFATDLKCSKYFTDQFKDFTGLDLSNRDNVPKPELLSEWKDTREYLEEKGMLKMPWCFTAPIKAGKAGDIARLVRDLSKSKKGEIENMFRHHDIVQSLTFLQHAPQGDFIVKYIMASNPLDELVTAFVSCKEELCGMARKYALEFTGMDFADPKNVPNVDLLFKWDDTAGFQTAEQTIAYTE